MHRLLILLCLLLFLACPDRINYGDNYEYDPLPGIVSYLDLPYSAASDSLQIQILFSPVRRDTSGRPYLENTYSWGIDNEYFYPASSVKMPVAALALQRLGELNLPADMPMLHGAGRAPQTAARTDTTTANGLPNVAQYLRKIFLSSDNDAFNRLYEWLGPEYINAEMRKRGLDSSRIIHRLGVSGFDTLGNRWLNPVSFGPPDSPRLELPERYAKFYDGLGLEGQLRGDGYYDSESDEIVYEDFDFRYRNYYHLSDMHGTVGRLVLPEAYAAEERFDLAATDYRLLWQAMAQRPRESSSPPYDYPDNYVKFWMFGDRDSTLTIPTNIRILNKVGWAYGYLTDAAYIVDLETGVEFLLTAAIHVNENQIFNDGEYEYESVGLPFFGELGRQLYQYESERRGRENLPIQNDLIRTIRSL